MAHSVPGASLFLFFGIRAKRWSLPIPAWGTLGGLGGNNPRRHRPSGSHADCWSRQSYRARSSRNGGRHHPGTIGFFRGRLSLCVTSPPTDAAGSLGLAALVLQLLGQSDPGRGCFNLRERASAMVSVPRQPYEKTNKPAERHDQIEACPAHQWPP
jgi:hypothetical protein